MNRQITTNSEFKKVNKGCMTLGVPMICIGFLIWGILKDHIDAAIIVIVLSALYYLCVLLIYKKNRKRKLLLEEIQKMGDDENNSYNTHTWKHYSTRDILSCGVVDNRNNDNRCYSFDYDEKLKTNV